MVTLHEKDISRAKFASSCALLLIIWCVEFAFRKNNIYPIEDHAIQSKLDAIDVAKKKVVKDSVFSSELFGGAHEFTESLVAEDNCCSAERPQVCIRSPEPTSAELSNSSGIKDEVALTRRDLADVENAAWTGGANDLHKRS